MRNERASAAENMNNTGNFHSDIADEIRARGFHILDKARARITGNYPNPFPELPELQTIELGKSYVVRLFIKSEAQGIERIDSGVIDVRIIEKLGSIYNGVIETLLPPSFPLKKGGNIFLKIEQILYRQTSRD